jgi:AcrR family transcriptional regulator
MSASTPRKASVRLSQEKRIRAIMAAARQVIAEKGYENVLMSEIAERADIVEGTLYRFFTSKRELLTRVADDWFEEVLETEVELPHIRGTWNRLHYLVRRALESVRRQPALSRYMLLEVRRNPDYRSTRSFDLNKRMTAEISQLCADAIASGEFRDDVSVPLLRDMIFGCIEHRTWTYLRGEGDFSVDEVAAGIASVVCRGMAAEPAPRIAAEGLGDVVGQLRAIAAALETSMRRP